MANSKLVVAMGLAAAALALAFANMVGGVAVLGIAGATVFVINAVEAGAAAFIISLRQRSLVVAGLLAVTGIMILIPPLIATRYFAIILFPGPIIGVLFGLGLLGMGVAKGVGMAGSVRVTPS